MSLSDSRGESWYGAGDVRVVGDSARRVNTDLVVQHVRSLMHCAGNTLDLVITFADQPPNQVITVNIY